MTELRFYGAVVVALVVLLVVINTMTVHRQARNLAADRKQQMIDKMMPKKQQQQQAQEAFLTPRERAQMQRRKVLHQQRLKAFSPNAGVDDDADIGGDAQFDGGDGLDAAGTATTSSAAPTTPPPPQGIWARLSSWWSGSDATAGSTTTGTNASGDTFTGPDGRLAMSRRQHSVGGGDVDSEYGSAAAAYYSSYDRENGGGGGGGGDAVVSNNQARRPVRKQADDGAEPAGEEDGVGGNSKVQKDLKQVQSQIEKLQEMMLLQQEYNKRGGRRGRGHRGGDGTDGGNNINIHIDLDEGGRHKNADDDDEDNNAGHGRGGAAGDDEDDDGWRRHRRHHHRRRPCKRNRRGHRPFTAADLPEPGDGSMDREDIDVLQRANRELDGDCDEERLDHHGGGGGDDDDDAATCPGFPPEDGQPFVPYRKKILSGTIYEPRMAYVTYISSSEFALPAAVLMFSIANTGSQYARAICVTKEVSQSDRSWLSLFAQIIEIDKIPSPLFVDNARYRDVFTKLRMWQLLMFDKVLYIDTDVVIKKNIDVLFDLAEWSVPMDAEEQRYSTGMMVLEPNADTFRAMMHDLKTTSVSMELPDLLFLKEFFERRGSSTGLRLDDVPAETAAASSSSAVVVPTTAPVSNNRFRNAGYAPVVQQSSWRWENGRWVWNGGAAQQQQQQQQSVGYGAWNPTPAPAAAGARGIINIIPRWFQVYHIEFGSLYHTYLTHRVQKLTIYDPRIYGLHFPGNGKPWQDMDKKMRKFAAYMCDPYTPEAKVRWRYQPQFIWYVLFGQMKRALRRLDRALVGAPIFESERGEPVVLREYVAELARKRAEAARREQQQPWSYNNYYSPPNGYGNNNYNNNNDAAGNSAAVAVGGSAATGSGVGAGGAVAAQPPNSIAFVPSSCVFWNDSAVSNSSSGSSNTVTAAAAAAVLFEGAAATTEGSPVAAPSGSGSAGSATAATTSAVANYRYGYREQQHQQQQQKDSTAWGVPVTSSPASDDTQQQPQSFDSWTFTGARRPVYDLTTLDPLVLVLPQRSNSTHPAAWEQTEVYTWVLSWCTRTMFRASADDTCGENAFVSQYSGGVCRANFFERFAMYRFGAVPPIRVEQPTTTTTTTRAPLRSKKHPAAASAAAASKGKKRVKQARKAALRNATANTTTAVAASNESSAFDLVAVNSNNSNTTTAVPAKNEAEQPQLEEYATGEGVVLRSAVRLSSPPRTKWIDVVVRCDWSMQNETDADFDFEHPEFSTAYTAVLVDALSTAPAPETTAAVDAAFNSRGGESGSVADAETAQRVAASAGLASIAVDKRYRIFVKSRCACPGGCGLARLWNETFVVGSGGGDQQQQQREGALRQSVRDAWARNVSGVDLKPTAALKTALLLSAQATTTTTTAAPAVASGSSSQIGSGSAASTTTTTTTTEAPPTTTLSPAEQQRRDDEAAAAAWSRIRAPRAPLQRCAVAASSEAKCGQVGFGRCLWIPPPPSSVELEGADSSSSSLDTDGATAATQFLHPQRARHDTWRHAHAAQKHAGLVLMARGNRTVGSESGVNDSSMSTTTTTTAAAASAGSDNGTATSAATTTVGGGAIAGGSCIPRHNASWILVSAASAQHGRVCNCSHLGGDGEQRVTLEQCLAKAEKAGANVVNFAGDLSQDLLWLLELSTKLGGVAPKSREQLQQERERKRKQKLLRQLKRKKALLLLANRSDVAGLRTGGRNNHTADNESLASNETTLNDTTTTVAVPQGPTMSPGERARLRAEQHRRAKRQRLQQQQGSSTTTAAASSSGSSAAGAGTSPTSQLSSDELARNLAAGRFATHFPQHKNDADGSASATTAAASVDDDGAATVNSHLRNSNKKKKTDDKAAAAKKEYRDAWLKIKAKQAAVKAKTVVGCYYKRCSVQDALSEQVPMVRDATGAFNVLVRNEGLHLVE